MATEYVYRTKTGKSPALFAATLKTVAGRDGFLVANEAVMDMSSTFREHGVEVDETFDLHMIQICKPDKAAVSLQANPERAILMPKFVMAFSSGDQTQVRFHHYRRETINALVCDLVFPDLLDASYRKIISMIDEAATE